MGVKYVLCVCVCVVQSILDITFQLIYYYYINLVLKISLQNDCMIQILSFSGLTTFILFY